MLHEIRIKLDLPEAAELDRLLYQEIASSMDVELGAFEKWFRGLGNDSLVGVERSILKTYLAWKLLYEEDLVGPKD